MWPWNTSLSHFTHYFTRLIDKRLHRIESLTSNQMFTTTLIQLSYGIPGVILYLVVIYAMIGVRRILNKSFIVIFVLTSAINFLTWLNSWLMLRLRAEPWFFFFYEVALAVPVVRNVLHFLVLYFYFAQNVCVFLLSFDRFAAIQSLTKNIEWWAKHYHILTIGLLMSTFALSLGTRVPIDSNLLYDHNTMSYNVHYEFTHLILSLKVQVIFGVGTLIICSCLNIISMRHLFLLRRTRSISIEISFFLISFCIFLAQFLNLAIVTTYTICFVYDLRPDYSIIDDLLNFTSDVFSIGPAFYTLLLPGPVRQFVVRKVKGFLETFGFVWPTIVRSFS
ncbi:hypothetical protein PMAYCL1PPCAC_27731 [Pristionchus mayeri]|uniref:Serpentine receptor class gamma n=1 Tax=Pristionchus mayeri TaxID=1317129 RepID=A0AAN5D6Y1_9BILA|nr:hypothetical protein PMAYCL1PPCAC_27731 [Pristionchus mayeri]